MHLHWCPPLLQVQLAPPCFVSPSSIVISPQLPLLPLIAATSSINHSIAAIQRLFFAAAVAEIHSNFGSQLLAVAAVYHRQISCFLQFTAEAPHHHHHSRSSSPPAFTSYFCCPPLQAIAAAVGLILDNFLHMFSATWLLHANVNCIFVRALHCLGQSIHRCISRPTESCCRYFTRPVRPPQTSSFNHFRLLPINHNHQLALYLNSASTHNKLFISNSVSAIEVRKLPNQLPLKPSAPIHLLFVAMATSSFAAEVGKHKIPKSTELPQIRKLQGRF
ncbi:OLC1v1004221C1 [Oldenlandia corymbosa var. corymbosa]|uniref:OLC1v1004221C1 n=1 Tax=Oldenlandia corymbosa var. corymbosa TaxID=529605 RepID=A0AAV1DE69_OLDCO|nr:OLC1v1004221C1 [Oldenlandia corymbosa var. corymbosa]